MGLIPDDLRTVTAQFPDRVAVSVVDGPSITYAEWEQRSNAAARGLAARGVTRGDRVALILDTSDAVDFAIGYLATHKAGGVAVPINPRYAPRELDHILDDCTPRVVVRRGELSSLADADTSAFGVELSGSDLADLFYTSGTTGLPKGVTSTHANAAHMPASPMTRGGIFLHALPLATFTGVHGAVLAPMRLGVTCRALPRFDALRYAEIVEKERASWLLMVPAHIALLLESGAFEGRDLAHVQTVMFGGAPTPPANVERLGELLPNAMLLNGYGLTEGGGSVCVLPPGEARNRPGSVGKPMPGVEVRIVDEAGAVLAPGEVGEISLKLPAGERAYYRDPEATAQTWRDGWVFTGDLGRIDDEGFLYIVDRKKDLIIRGGYNVYSVEVESALAEHPDVAEVAVVGIAHPVLGQDVAAVVRLRAGADELTLGTAREFVTDRLADYKRPRRLVVRTDPLPRTAAGKVDKAALLRDLGET